MAKPFRTGIDLIGNELLNPRAQNLAAAPSSPNPGVFWFNTTSGKFEFRGNGGVNVDPTDRARHTGTQAAATIADFDTQVRTSRLNQFATPNADIGMGGFTFTGLRDAAAAGEPCTYGQLQNVANGTDWKASVRAATTGPITLSGPQTIDGVAVIAGDRVLVKDQAAPAANGIYVVAAGAWARAADATTGTLTSGAAVMVTEGTVNGDAQWRLTTNDPLVVGTTALAWTQIGAGVSYSQGTGISIAGNVISADTAVVVRKYSADVGGATSIPVTHGLGTRDVTVAVYDVATYEEIECDVVRTNVNTVTLGFTVAPAAASLRCVVHG